MMRSVAALALLGLFGFAGCTDQDFWHWDDSLQGKCAVRTTSWTNGEVFDAMPRTSSHEGWRLRDEPRYGQGISLQGSIVSDRWLEPRLEWVEWTDDSLAPRVDRSHNGGPTLAIWDDGKAHYSAVYRYDTPIEAVRGDFVRFITFTLGISAERAQELSLDLARDEGTMFHNATNVRVNHYQTVFGGPFLPQGFMDSISAGLFLGATGYQVGHAEWERDPWRVGVSVPARHAVKGSEPRMVLHADAAGAVQFAYGAQELPSEAEAQAALGQAWQELGLPGSPGSRSFGYHASVGCPGVA